jgi:hypothetical protein
LAVYWRFGGNLHGVGTKFQAVTLDMSFADVQNLLGPPQHGRSGAPEVIMVPDGQSSKTAIWKGRGERTLERIIDEGDNVAAILFRN